ncbi:hypothetical protein BpHYR1_048894 [Brachionus plicatilis]|uniref:Uncharacterized protein n=1 Tax=Brachionus plicatilis TaxID=10195 RepID=A0A3M7SS18_BRAPC|nr:hypothetical protein BpHYR1_048894 [Brachionus plicatilis]
MKSVSRNIQCQINKVSWCLKQNEPFSLPFKNNFDNENYTTLKLVYEDAARIYSRHCLNYCAAKATISSEKGV